MVSQAGSRLNEVQPGANEVQRLGRSLTGDGAARLPRGSCAGTGRRLGRMAGQQGNEVHWGSCQELAKLLDVLIGHWSSGWPLEARPGPTGPWQAAGKKRARAQHCRKEVHGCSGGAACDGPVRVAAPAAQRPNEDWRRSAQHAGRRAAQQADEVHGRAAQSPDEVRGRAGQSPNEVHGGTVARRRRPATGPQQAGAQQTGLARPQACQTRQISPEEVQTGQKIPERPRFAGKRPGQQNRAKMETKEASPRSSLGSTNSGDF